MSLTTRRTLLRIVAAPVLALGLICALGGPAFAQRYEDRYEDRRSGYNSEYLFAATKTVTNLDVSPAAKVPLIPLTLILDLVALPFEAIAGFF